MASLGGINTIKLWTCCGCRSTRISMNLGDCPECDHLRCFDCDVKTHVVLEAKEEEDTKTHEIATRVPGTEHEARRGRHLHLHGDLDVSEVAETLPSSVLIPQLAPTSFIRGPSNPMLLIPIASGIEHHPLFVLREDSDANLIAQWHSVLPVLSRELLTTNRDTSVRITSIHLLRVGLTEAKSQPTLLVNTSQSLSESETSQLQKAISFPYPESSGPLRQGYLVDFVGPSHSLQILFKQSKVRRSVGVSSSPPPPPICLPRNCHFSGIPGTGTSIGIAGSIEDTATLGCYALVGSVLMILTVDHLIPRTSTNPHLTHISEQDRFEMLLPCLFKVFCDLKASSDHSCGLCAAFRNRNFSTDEQIRAGLHSLLKAPSGLGLESCSFYQALKPHCQSGSICEVIPIATQFRKSGTRCRWSGPDAREMDWALFTVDDDFSVEVEEQLLVQHNESMTRRPNELHVHDMVKPGAWVRSVGRTSGHQRGQLNTSISAVFLEDYATQEWCVIKRPEDSLDEWIRGGIGVEGDSGALIVDEEDDGVYGMLWGRTGEGPATMTIFTPLREIFWDIRERTGKTVELLRGQQMPFPESPEIAEPSHQIESVPIVLSMDEKGQEAPPERAAYALETLQLSSADTRHPHSFERYRGRDRPSMSVPRSAVQVTEETVERSRWPGVHTYLRYAVAPEQE